LAGATPVVPVCAWQVAAALVRAARADVPGVQILDNAQLRRVPQA